MSNVLQLKVQGLQDIYLYGTPDPDNVPFKHVLSRSTAVATEYKTYPLSLNFGDTFVFNVPHDGQFLGGLTVALSLPPIRKSDGEYVGWTNGLMYALFESVDLQISGQTIASLDSVGMDVLDELETRPEDRDWLGDYVGKYDFFNTQLTDTTKLKTYFLPLKFWFAKAVKDAFPVGALYYHEMTVRMVLRRFEDLVVFDGATAPSSVNIAQSSIVAQWLYVDQKVFDAITAQPLTYRIQQTQSVSYGVAAQQTRQIFPLTFNHPVQQLHWVFVDKESTENNDYFNYSRRPDSSGFDPTDAMANYMRTTSPTFMKEAAVIVDGTELSGTENEVFYRTYMHATRGRSVPRKRVYSLFFDAATSDMLTGTFNFSRISNANLLVTYDTKCPAHMCHIYAVNYNIMVVQNGLFSIKFAS